MEEAQEVYDECQESLKKNVIGIILGVLALPVGGILGMLFITQTESLFLFYLPILIIIMVSFWFGGGCGPRFSQMLAAPWKMAFWGWAIFPVSVVATIALAMCVFLFCPWVFILIERRRIKKDMNVAEDYLQHSEAIHEYYNKMVAGEEQE